MQSKVPILFVISSHPELAPDSFQSVRRYRPDRLYLAVDGGRVGEQALCREASELVLGQVDWACDVRQLLLDRRAGREQCVNETLAWMLESEAYGIVVEDDRAMDEDFFRFCEEALPWYSDDGRSVAATGASHVPLGTKCW
jgi:hypothetical protein